MARETSTHPARRAPFEPSRLPQSDPETPADAKQLLHDILDEDLECYRVGREVNTSARDKQPRDLPSMIEPIHLL